MHLPARLGWLIPDLGEVAIRERVRASLGAMLGLLITGFVSRAALGPSPGLPLLIAPMGASAVLLFGVPSSPLAQPWSILGGNVVSALIGVTAARLIGDPIAAAAIGGALAIAAMMMLRCLHPPSGAVALTAVLGGPAVQAAGYGFALWPVGLNSVLLLAAALAFNNATGRRYPHRPARGNASDVAAASTVLRRHGEVIDVGREDLTALAGEIEAERKPDDRRTCAEVMRCDIVPLEAAMPLDAALDRLLDLGCTAMPIVDAVGRYGGWVGQGDLIRHLRPTRVGRRSTRLFQRSLRFEVTPRTVGEVAVRQHITVGPDMPLSEAYRRAALAGADLAVLDEAGYLLGLLTQADLLRSATHTAQPCGQDAERPQPRSVIHRL